MPKLAILCSGSGAMPKIRQGADKDLRLADIMVSGGPLNSRAALDGQADAHVEILMSI